jgi:plastocyanin
MTNVEGKKIHVIRQTGRFLAAGLLAATLAGFPAVAAAQSNPAPAAMAEASLSDINSWGFGAVVPVGTTVTWTNMGTQAHSVTAPDGSFDSGLVAPGDAATIQFDAPGVYTYLCTPHPWMKGVVVVSADAAEPAPSMAMVEGSTSDINSWGYAVSVTAGQSVQWTNVGSQAHTATAVNGSFDTGLVAPGGSASIQFDTPGLRAYVCTPHPWMKGSVAVLP